jgi:hypothetical protein
VRVRLALLAAGGFLACWGIAHFTLYRHESKKLVGDVGIYSGYGLPVRHGLLPYRDFGLDYPPGALPAFIAPAYLGDYEAGFEWSMAVLGACIAAIVALLRPGRAGIAFVVVSPLLVGTLMPTRFDLWPTLLMVAALAALVVDRHRLGFGLLGAAIAAKAFPIVLVPPAVVWTARRAGRAELARAAGCGVAVCVAAFLPFFVLAPHGTWVSVWGQASRPLQVESLGGALMITIHKAGIEFTHGSHNVTGTLSTPLAAALTVAQVAALACVWTAFARAPVDRARLLRFSAASVCAFVALGRVLSPQYLIWLVPLVALVAGRRGLVAIGVLTAALLLTHVWIPSRYFQYIYENRWTWAVLLRDLALIALLAVLSLPGRLLSRPPRSLARARSS